MLAFVDESGDTGFNFEKGSTRFFVVSVVIFEDENEAMKRNEQIQRLKQQLGCAGDFEFHFVEELRRYVIKGVNKNEILVKSIKMQPASSNNLIQLADYVSGVVK